MGLALVDLLEETFKLRSDIEAVEPADGRVDVVDKEAVQLLETLNHTRVDLVHVEGIRNGGRVEAVLVGLLDVRRDIAMIDVIVWLDRLVGRVEVRLHIGSVVVLRLAEVRVELLVGVLERTTTGRIDALLPDETPSFVGLAIDGTRHLVSAVDPWSSSVDDRTSVGFGFLLSEVNVRLDDRRELVVSVSEIAAHRARVVSRVVESERARRTGPQRCIDQVEEGDATSKRNEPASQAAGLLCLTAWLLPVNHLTRRIVERELDRWSRDGGAAASPGLDLALSGHGGCSGKRGDQTRLWWDVCGSAERREKERWMEEGRPSGQS